MRKATKLYVLLGVLLVVCVAAFAVSHYEEKKEQIKNTGDEILAIPTDSVTALSWTNSSGTFSFTKGESWTYDDDAAFPVDEEKINELLSLFESFSAAFTIDDVEDYSQYGLDEPECTISITAGEETYTIELGSISVMDDERYISVGDGRAYLVAHDPLEDYDAVLSDVVLNDDVPEFDTTEKITFTGSENYTIERSEDIKSLCAEDVYFAESKPLDTENVDELVETLQGLILNSYVTYNVTDEELATYGLNEPELTISIDYSSTDDEGNETDSGTIELEFSRNPEEVAAYEEAMASDADSIPYVTCYVRVNQSQIVYTISRSTYEQIMKVSYNDLRHKELFTGNFDSITSIDIELDGETRTFVYTAVSEDDVSGTTTGTWTYNDEEIDITDFETAFTAVAAADFTEEEPTEQEEISLTVHLDNEDFPTYTLTLYRYDGTNCIASVDGVPTAFVTREKTVDLIEAVNGLTLGK
jgi:hypothetical protein